MSCSVCLLPFVTGPGSISPKFPPAGVIPQGHMGFYVSVIGMSYTLVGCMLKMYWQENNLFTATDHSLFVNQYLWEVPKVGTAPGVGKPGCYLAMHNTCANLLRKAFGLEDDNNTDQLIELAEIEAVFGRMSNGSSQGIARFPHVRYEEVSGIDMRQFWGENRQPGQVCFDWLGLKDSDMNWVLNRPDIFPRFFNEVTQKRLESIGEPAKTKGILTSLPMDVLFKLLPYLDIRACLSLTSTCRTLRKLALVEFQSHARKIVLSIPWSTPLLRAFGESEYRTDPPGMVHLETSPATGDWLLYLSHIHRTNSMRERRRIWNICVEIKEQYDRLKPNCSYSKNRYEQMKTRKRCRAVLAILDEMKQARQSGPNGPKSGRNLKFESLFFKLQKELNDS